MAWTVEGRFDDDKEDVGTVTVVWNAGQPNEFRYGPFRGAMSEVPYFVPEVFLAKAEWDAKRAREAAAMQTIADALNTYVPEEG